MVHGLTRQKSGISSTAPRSLTFYVPYQNFHEERSQDAAKRSFPSESAFSPD
jgi:hypothetical protein